MASARHIAMLSAALILWGCASGPQSAYVNPDSAFTSAMDLRSEGKHKEAAEAFLDFAQRFDHDQRAHLAQYMAGEEYSEAGLFFKALSAFDELYRNFKYSDYLGRADRRTLEMGIALLESGDDRGREFLEKVKVRAPYSPAAYEARMYLGRNLYKKGKFDDAHFEFDAVSRNTSGVVRAEADMNAALAACAIAAKSPGNAGALENAMKRLEIVRSAELSVESMGVVDAALKDLSDKAAEQHMILASFYLKQAEPMAALAHLKEITEKYPLSRLHKPAADLTLFIYQEAARLRAARAEKLKENEK